MRRRRRRSDCPVHFAPSRCSAILGRSSLFATLMFKGANAVLLGLLER